MMTYNEFAGYREQIESLRQQLAAAQAEINEQARIVGMGGEREIALREQLAAFHSAVEHVTEDGCIRRSFVAMPEGWAMVHKDRLHDLELAEEQLAATDGLSSHIMCEKEPVVWMQSDHLSRFVHHACGSQAALVRCSDHQLMPDFQPLYRANEQKP